VRIILKRGRREKAKEVKNLSESRLKVLEIIVDGQPRGFDPG